MDCSCKSPTLSLENEMGEGSPPLFGDREIHVHIGAHKTATTFIQNTLEKNSNLLESNKIFYISLDEMRSARAKDTEELTNQIIALTHSDRIANQIPDLRQKITRSVKSEKLVKCQRILISEENLSLQLDGFLKGEAYSCLGQRLKHLGEELGMHTKIFFSIRDYPDFLSSTFVEILRHHNYVPFGDFLDCLYHELPALWSEAYRELITLFGSDNVLFWDFEDTVRNPQAVLSMLAWDITGFEVDSTPVRQSLSQKAVEFIRDFNSLPGTPMSPAVISKIADRLYPLSATNGKFDPWTPKERKALSKRYKEEIKEIPLKSFAQ